MPSACVRARLLSHHGRQAWAADDDGHHFACVYKGRDLQPVVNDTVLLDTTTRPAVITSIAPRRNQLIRSEAHRHKGLAANIDGAVIVISGEPLFSDVLLARMICACVAEGVLGVIALNKIDLQQASERARAQLAPFARCLAHHGWHVIELAAKSRTPAEAAHPMHAGLSQLRDWLGHRTTVIMGQSGMGKSSLLNALVPDFNARTREVSEALQTGKHTTTAGQAVALDAHSWLIDTPGFQLFGLDHLSETQIALGFPEWQQVQEHDGRCRFNNCHHLNEPGCTVQAAAQRNAVPPRRLQLWSELIRNG